MAETAESHALIVEIEDLLGQLEALSVVRGRVVSPAAAWRVGVERRRAAGQSDKRIVENLRGTVEFMRALRGVFAFDPRLAEAPAPSEQEDR